MTLALLTKCGWHMLPDKTKPKIPRNDANDFRRLRRAIGRRCRRRFRSALTVASDPVLPLLVLGVLAAAFVAALLFKSPAEIVFAILLIGCLTAFIETKLHNKSRDP